MDGISATSRLDFADQNFGCRSPRELVTFFQAWLYFGSPTEALRYGAGVHFEISDFIRVCGNQKFVTEIDLPGLIENWRDRRGQIDIQRRSHTISMLKHVKEYVNLWFAQFQRYAENVWPLEKCPWPLILESVSALGFTPEGAVERIYGTSIPGNEWPGSRSHTFLRARWSNSGWYRGNC